MFLFLIYCLIWRALLRESDRHRQTLTDRGNTHARAHARTHGHGRTRTGKHGGKRLNFNPKTQTPTHTN